MISEILLAFIQAATEFLPVSSSGHLALFGNLFSEVNLFYFTVLHVASLFAILIFTRKDIYNLLTFDSRYHKLWMYIIIGVIPAGFFGFFFHSFIEGAFSSLISLSIAFLFSGIVLLGTRSHQNKRGGLNLFSSLIVGFSQILALFPGVSRSGTTISFGLYSGLKKEEAFRFSFLISIPLILGAIILELKDAYFSVDLLVGFIVCFVFSLIFLNLLHLIIRRNYFWLFGFYCLLMSLISFLFWIY